MNSSPKVSVIIPVYNREKFIKETIESVLKQTYQDFEIIVVDDGSTDKSAEIIKGFSHRRIIYIYQKNSGVSNARNKGILNSKGKYIAFLDSDDLWLPEKLEKQISILESLPEVGLVYSDCYMIDSQGRVIGRVFEQAKPSRGNIFPNLFLDNFISCLTAVVRKTVLDKVGVSNPCFSIAQDYDLFLRIAQLFEIEYVNLPLAKYRTHSSSLSRNSLLAYQEQFEILEKYLKSYPKLKDILKGKIPQRFAELHYSLGRTHQLQKQFSQSRKELLKSIHLYPLNIKAYLCWFLSLLRIAVPEKRNFLKGKGKKWN